MLKDGEVGTARQDAWRRPERRFMDVVKEDMKLVDVREGDAEDSGRGRQMICCGDC